MLELWEGRTWQRSTGDLWQAARRSGYDAAAHCNSSQPNDGKARIQNLDVLDLRLHIQRGGGSSGGRNTGGDPLGGRTHELDLPGVWRPQGGFRDGRILVPGMPSAIPKGCREPRSPRIGDDPERASEVRCTRLCFDWTRLYSVETRT